MILSLFCGAGGLDLGFEDAGFDVGLAFDVREDSVSSYNANRAGSACGHVADVSRLSLARLDELWGGEFRPEGIIGGPPCQSFSKANTEPMWGDPRHVLPLAYAQLLGELNARNPVKFFVMENVPGLTTARHKRRLSAMKTALRKAGFTLNHAVLNACDYCTPQRRERLFIVGFNTALFGDRKWSVPSHTTTEDDDLTVAGAIGSFPEVTYFRRGLTPADIGFHPNHWCMAPKSAKFEKAGALKPGNGNNRSFKTLAWDRPSITVAYGNREVHIHPSCKRRLSVFEAMKLQGFPDRYRLLGTLSSQIVQVSEAVPPPLAEAVAASVAAQLELGAASPRAGNLPSDELPQPLLVAHQHVAASQSLDLLRVG